MNVVYWFQNIMRMAMLCHPSLYYVMYLRTPLFAVQLNVLLVCYCIVIVIVIVMVIVIWRYLNITYQNDKRENEEDLDFTRNRIIISMLLISTIFTSYSSEGISFSSRSINIRALAKVLILTTGIFLSLGLWNNYSLNAPNFQHL